MTVALVTDSAASLPEEFVHRHHLQIVPIHTIIGESSFPDGAIPLQDVISRLDEGVSTSGPSPGEFAAAIEEAGARADEVLVLTIASSMSGTHRAAVVAADEAEIPTRVLDTRTAAGAEALVVLAAAREAEAGGSLDDVEAVAKSVSDRVRLVATVDSLDQLVKSGRVPNIAGRAGRYFGVNPIFEFRDGRARPLRPAFSREAALDRIVDACHRQRGQGPLHVAALHAADAETADRLLSAVTFEEESDGVAEAFVGSFSAGMIAHTGPGLAGLAWWWE